MKRINSSTPVGQVHDLYKTNQVTYDGAVEALVGMGYKRRQARDIIDDWGTPVRSSANRAEASFDRTLLSELTAWLPTDEKEDLLSYVKKNHDIPEEFNWGETRESLGDEKFYNEVTKAMTLDRYQEFLDDYDKLFSSKRLSSSAVKNLLIDFEDITSTPEFKKSGWKATLNDNGTVTLIEDEQLLSDTFDSIEDFKKYCQRRGICSDKTSKLPVNSNKQEDLAFIYKAVKQPSVINDPQGPGQIGLVPFHEQLYVEGDNGNTVLIEECSDELIHQIARQVEIERPLGIHASKEPVTSDLKRDIQKMIEYRQKGSNPEALARSVKDMDKAKNRLAIAKAMGWSEAEDAFFERLMELGASNDDIMTIPEVDLSDVSDSVNKATSVGATGRRSLPAPLDRYLRSLGLSYEMESMTPTKQAYYKDLGNGRRYTLMYKITISNGAVFYFVNHSNEGGGTYGYSLADDPNNSWLGEDLSVAKCLERLKRILPENQAVASAKNPKHPEFGGIPAWYTQVGDMGLYYVGPFSTQQEADSFYNENVFPNLSKTGNTPAKNPVTFWEPTENDRVFTPDEFLNKYLPSYTKHSGGGIPEWSYGDKEAFNKEVWRLLKTEHPEFVDENYEEIKDHLSGWDSSFSDPKKAASDFVREVVELYSSKILSSGWVGYKEKNMKTIKSGMGYNLGYHAAKKLIKSDLSLNELAGKLQLPSKIQTITYDPDTSEYEFWMKGADPDIPEVPDGDESEWIHEISWEEYLESLKDRADSLEEALNIFNFDVKNAHKPAKTKKAPSSYMQGVLYYGVDILEDRGYQVDMGELDAFSDAHPEFMYEQYKKSKDDREGAQALADFYVKNNPLPELKPLALEKFVELQNEVCGNPGKMVDFDGWKLKDDPISGIHRIKAVGPNGENVSDSNMKRLLFRMGYGLIGSSQVSSKQISSSWVGSKEGNHFIWTSSDGTLVIKPVGKFYALYRNTDEYVDTFESLEAAQGAGDSELRQVNSSMGYNLGFRAALEGKSTEDNPFKHGKPGSALSKVSADWLKGFDAGCEVPPGQEKQALQALDYEDEGEELERRNGLHEMYSEGIDSSLLKEAHSLGIITSKELKTGVLNG